MIVDEFVPLAHRDGRQRASDDDIIVGIRWELGDLIVDRSIGLHDCDGEE